MKLFLKTIRKSLITILAAIISIVFIYGGYTIFAAPKYEFEKFDPKIERPEFLIIQGKYSSEINDLFNKKIEKALEIFSTPDGVNSPNFFPPRCCSAEENITGNCKALIEDTCKNKCTDDNVSPYCVSVIALDMYQRYVTILKIIRGRADISPMGAAYMNVTPLTQVVYLGIEATNNAIDEEYDKARKILEATLSAYNEFLTAYPIHAQYESIISNLIIYKKKLKDIRRQVDQFPDEFVDATATKCQ